MHLLQNPKKNYFAWFLFTNKYKPFQKQLNFQHEENLREVVQVQHDTVAYLEENKKTILH